MRNVFPVLSLLAVVALLAGCATPAQVGNMTITADSAKVYVVSKDLTGKVGMGEVSGGEATNPLWASEIGNTEFSKALTDSLAMAHLLAAQGKGDYTLTAKLLKVDQPMMGFSLTVTTRIEYTLTRKSDGKVVFSKVVTAAHTATVSDAVIGVERLRLANEGSARDNIREIVNSLYMLDIKPGQVSLK